MELRVSCTFVPIRVAVPPVNPLLAEHDRCLPDRCVCVYAPVLVLLFHLPLLISIDPSFYLA